MRSTVTRLRVLIDVNVILDAINGREPFAATSAEVLALANAKHIEGWVAAHSLTTFYYLSSKYLSRDVAHVQLTELLQFLKVAAVDARVIELALALPYKDFEDAVQMMAAVRAELDCIVTRDATGFRTGPLPAMSPAQLLAMMGTGS